MVTDGENSSVWGVVVPWCPPRGEYFLFPCRSRRLGPGRGRTTQRGRSLVVLRALVRTRTGEAPLSGHVLGERRGLSLP